LCILLCFEIGFGESINWKGNKLQRLVIILAINLMLVFHKYLFQGSYIRIYNVEKGWKVQKNILAKSLRWTVTDTSLSPDQRHLVSLNF
jgi:hypothetical protein